MVYINQHPSEKTDWNEPLVEQDFSFRHTTEPDYFIDRGTQARSRSNGAESLMSGAPGPAMNTVRWLSHAGIYWYLPQYIPRG